MKTCTSCGGLRVEPGDGYPGQMVSGRPCSCPHLAQPSQLDRIEAMLLSLEAGEFRSKLNRIEQKLDHLLNSKQ